MILTGMTPSNFEKLSELTQCREVSCKSNFATSFEISFKTSLQQHIGYRIPALRKDHPEFP